MQPVNLEITWQRSTSEERETLAKAGEGSWKLFLVEPKGSRKLLDSIQVDHKYKALEMQRLIDAAG